MKWRTVSRTPHKSAEEARSQLPDLLDAAEKGRSTVITRHGRPVAALVPLGEYHRGAGQKPLSAVAVASGIEMKFFLADNMPYL